MIYESFDTEHLIATAHQTGDLPPLGAELLKRLEEALDAEHFALEEALDVVRTHVFNNQMTIVDVIDLIGEEYLHDQA